MSRSCKTKILSTLTLILWPLKKKGRKNSTYTLQIFSTIIRGKGNFNSLLSFKIQFQYHIVDMDLYIVFVFVFRQTFQVYSKFDPSNLAYTNAELGLHVDLPFYVYPPNVRINKMLIKLTLQRGCTTRYAPCMCGDATITAAMLEAFCTFQQ